MAPPAAPTAEPATIRGQRSWLHVAAIAGANAGVAGLGFLGNLLLARHLEVTAFAAISLFLAAFQFLQEGMGKSLNWALLRLAPRTERERAGGGAAMVRATASLQRRFAIAGPLFVASLALMLHSWLDAHNGPSTAWLLGLASLGAAGAVLFQFDLGLLQLRERFFAMSSWMVSQSLLRLLLWVLLWQFGVLDMASALACHLAATFTLCLLLRARTGPLPAADAATLERDRATVLHFGGRMVLATTLAAVAAQVDLFLIDATAGDEHTARYRVATLVATAVELASSAVMIALLPGAGRAHTAEDRRAGLRRSRRWGLLIAVLGLITLPIVQYALPVLFGERYAEAAALYPILLGGVIVTALTDPLGLQFLSNDQPYRFVLLNGTMLVAVVLGNLLLPGDDRALVAAWVRTGSRVLLGAGIVFLLWSDSRNLRAQSLPPVEPGPP